MLPLNPEDYAEVPISSDVPNNTVENRALLQTRLAIFGRFATLLTLAVAALGAAVMALLDASGAGWHWRAPLTYACSALVYAGIWFTARGRRRLGQRVLIFFDLLLVVTCSITCALVGWQAPLGTRPETLGAFLLGQALTARAVYIPSTALRTAIVSSMSAVPLVVFTYGYYLKRDPSLHDPLYTAFASILAMSIVAVATVTSRVIYGLRRKVREARRLGQYTLLDKIGEGGMGVVYRARHAMLRRPTAVKLLSSGHGGEQSLRSFEREAQLTSLLSHPNTVSVYDFGRTPDGVFYYAMEYLDAIDLDALVRCDGPQPPNRVLHLLIQICGALNEAHGIGLIHRDIKPQNLLLCEAGGLSDVIKVVDFGLVKAVPEAVSVHSSLVSKQQSALNLVVGTPAYMSPESFVTPADVDARSDLYALGAVAYLLLTGTPLFAQARTVLELCGHHLHTPPESLTKRAGKQLPDELERLVLACLEKRPECRPASASELRARLHDCAVRMPWTEAEAQSWWRKQGDRVRAFARAERAATHHVKGSRASPVTVAVDLRVRQTVEDMPTLFDQQILTDRTVEN